MKRYTPIRLIIADDHEIYRNGLVQILKKEPDLDIVGQASNGTELSALLYANTTDILLADMALPYNNGTSAVQYALETFPEMNIIALSAPNSLEPAKTMLQAGVHGYLLKTSGSTEVLEAIHSVYNKEVYCSRSIHTALLQLFAKERQITTTPVFSERELEIIHLICEDLSNKEIAAKLLLSRRTVEGYRLKIMEKLNVHGTAGIVLYALKHHIYTIT